MGQRRQVERSVKLDGKELIKAVGAYIAKREGIEPFTVARTNRVVQLKDGRIVSLALRPDDEDPKAPAVEGETKSEVARDFIPYPLHPKTPGVTACINNKLRYAVEFSVFADLETLETVEHKHELTWLELKAIVEELSGEVLPDPALAYETPPRNANKTFRYKYWADGSGDLEFKWVQVVIVPSKPTELTTEPDLSFADADETTATTDATDDETSDETSDTDDETSDTDDETSDTDDETTATTDATDDELPTRFGGA